MNITCPNCDTRFIVDKTLIDPSSGRKMKCSRCSYIWHHKLDQVDESKPNVFNSIKTDMHSDDKLSSIHSTIPSPSTIIVEKKSNISAFIMISIMMIISIIPNNFALFSSINSNKFQIYITKVNYLNNEKNSIDFEYDIVNNSSNDVNVPSVKIVLLNKNNTPLKTYIDNNADMIITGNNRIHLSKRLKDIPIGVDKLELITGNMLDFFLF